MSDEEKEARIRWDDKELEILKNHALEYMREYPGTPIYRAVAEAQKCLGEDRQRNIIHRGSVPPKLRELLEAETGGAQLVPQDRLNEVTEQLNKARDTIKDQRAYINTLEARPKPRTEIEILKEFCADVLAEAMRRSTAPTGAAAGPINMNDVAEAVQRQRHNSEPDPEGGPRKPKIIVVGPMREQTQELLSRYDGKLKLRIFTSGEIRGRTSEVANGADKVVFWTKFAGHDVFQGLPREKIVMAPTWQTIIEVLDDIAQKGVQ